MVDSPKTSPYGGSALPQSRLSAGVAALLMVAIVAAGLLLRVWNVNFDQGIGSHPDERSTSCFYATSIHLPASWEQFWNPQQSPLNPLWDVGRQERRGFTYGHFPLYLGVAAGEAMHVASPLAERLGVPENAVALMARASESCDAIAVAGRLTIALLDTLTIVFLYFLARRLYGRGAGLLAAAFYAFAAQAIQLSHFFAMDPASTTFTVLAILGSVIVVQERRWRGAVIAGVGAGLAIASKFSALPILAAPVVAAGCVLYAEWQKTRTTGARPDGHAQLVAVVGAVLALALAGITFFVTSPYAVLDSKNFLQATLVEQGRMVRGVADFPFTRQYRNTTPYLYFIQQQMEWGLGWPLGLVAAAGALWALVRAALSIVTMFRGRWVAWANQGELVVWSWLIPYFGITGAFLAKFNRYMSPVLPFVLLFAAGLIVWLWGAPLRKRATADGTAETVDSADGAAETVDSADDGADDDVDGAGDVENGAASEATPAVQEAAAPVARGWRLAARVLSAILIVVAVGGAVFWSLAYVDGVYGREHTWITASRWIYENAPRDSVILWELWDDPLPKSVPGEAGMDMGSKGLRNIDWSPYEEDTPEKYEILKAKLREADYVAYSSKRIYDSVDELPRRYPMTNLYYDAMWDGRLGFDLAQEVTSPPSLFGWRFDDRHADESWSLYDHPQVSIFRKVRDLSDAEFDALFQQNWMQAVPYDRGPVSPLNPLLAALGMGVDEASANQGIINRIVARLSGEQGAKPPPDPNALLLDTPLSDLPVVDDYRWNTRAAASPFVAVVTWWAVLSLIGWLAWPIGFVAFRPLRDRGYLLSRALGWLLGGWLLWMWASVRFATFTVRNAWITVGLLAVVGLAVAWSRRAEMARFLREKWPSILAGEALFALAYLGFVGIRMLNPDLWQPWFGGEKFMEMAFYNGILRSPWFPPVDAHFAGGFINYYYFGIYLVAYLTKLTGIPAEIAFNLAIPTLFALTVVNSFAVAYAAAPEHVLAGRWWKGFAAALLAPVFVVAIGNLDGFAQVVRSLAAMGTSTLESVIPGVATLADASSGLLRVASGAAPLPVYDFWGPSRVIPATINEFPFWSFLFADLHPHLIGIPFAAFFLALTLTLIRSGSLAWRREWHYALLLLVLFSLVLGTLASVNLWELPTYLALGALALIVSQYWGHGRVRWLWTLAMVGAYGLLAGVLFLPFFSQYKNVGASGIGLVRAGDDVGLWLLIWGFLGFVLISWLCWAAARPARPRRVTDGDEVTLVRPDGFERTFSLGLRDFDNLPRMLHLRSVLGARRTFGYLLLGLLIPVTVVATLVAVWFEREVLALCLPWLTLAFLLLWRRGKAADAGAQFAILLAVTGLAILAGTQLIYLKDFLGGGDWYRMNTLFKFFSQVWVLFGIGAAIGLARLWGGWVRRGSARLVWRGLWVTGFVLLLAASLAFPILGTPARADERMVGWRPALGTLNGLDYMREGSYTWPDASTVIELRYDWEAIQWLLDHVRGNATIVESSEADYYRAGSSRVASLTGLSALRGMHESEQRYGEQVGPRDGLHREFWTTDDRQRFFEIVDELRIDLIYVGQLERNLHPAAVERLAAMAASGELEVLFQNAHTVVYAVPGRLQSDAVGNLVPSGRGDAAGAGE